MKVTVIFGVMVFNEGNSIDTCIIYEIEGIVKIDKDKAENFGEDIISDYTNQIDSYVIPELYDGRIYYKCDKFLNVPQKSESKKLDVKSLVNDLVSENKKKEKLRLDERSENIKRLMPYVIDYLRYVVDLHNSIVIKSCAIGGQYLNNIRATIKSKDLIDADEIVKQYTEDFYFNKINGGSWECNLFHIRSEKSPTIFLTDVENRYLKDNPICKKLDCVIGVVGFETRQDTSTSLINPTDIETYIVNATKKFLNK